jgi:hypothetical protein
MIEASLIVFNFVGIKDSFIIQDDQAVQPHIEEL